VSNLKKEVETFKLEKSKNLQTISALTLAKTELQSNYDILTDLYEEKREDLAKLMANISNQANCIIELRAIEAKYKGMCPKNNQEVQTLFNPCKDQQV
jgi:hypothetical protein